MNRWRAPQIWLQQEAFLNLLSSLKVSYESLALVEMSCPIFLLVWLVYADLLLCLAYDHRTCTHSTVSAELGPRRICCRLTRHVEASDPVRARRQTWSETNTQKKNDSCKRALFPLFIASKKLRGIGESPKTSTEIETRQARPPPPPPPLTHYIVFQRLLLAAQPQVLVSPAIQEKQGSTAEAAATLSCWLRPLRYSTHSHKPGRHLKKEQTTAADEHSTAATSYATYPNAPAVSQLPQKKS